jgi:myo-inositol 2-dehydrogenase / D-chiro-inositol 1-dehydrogenase
MALVAPMQIAVFGAGRIGYRHARTVATEVAGARLAAICDVNLEAAKSLAELTGCDRYTSDPADIFDDPAIDAVIIGSSTDSHAPLIEGTAAAGKQIFCEKPIALDLETTDRAIEEAARAGVQLQIGFQRRFDKAYAKVSQMIERGELGQIEAVRDTMRDPNPPHESYIPTSGGLFRDMVIHDFDCVRWLMGCEPVEIFAMGANLVDPVFAKYGDIDTCVVTIKFESGALGAIDASRRSGFGYDVRTEIFGSKSAVLIGERRDTPLYRLDSSGVWSDHIYWFLERFDDAYVAEIRSFVECLRNDEPVQITGADGRAALAMAYAAEASMQENAPVAMSRFARQEVT